MSIITLTTDFGLEDWFVGTMKGVLLGINPHARIVDLTHGIQPGDIHAAAFALAAAFRFFPRGTVHVAVVDPGVGSARAALAIETANHILVGPDNGVLSLALTQDPPKAIHRVDNPNYFLKNVSQTFHGRDVFAPVAAHLSRGVPLCDMGARQPDYQRLELAWPIQEGARFVGKVVYIDRFGNAITNFARELPVFNNTASLKVAVGPGRDSFAIHEFYQAVDPGRPLAIFGSTGFLEVAINGGHAAQVLALRIGDPVSIEQ